MSAHAAPLSLTRQWTIYAVVFGAGVAAMAVAGFILVEGMLKFGGDSGTQSVFIAAGVIFQICETICFVASASMTGKSVYWRIGLLVLGILLFAFSIAIMTLAQKATLHHGELNNQAISQNINHLNSQIESLDKMIASYRHNAEKQSQSIYADSREKGQDSLNRAALLEQDKLKLMEKQFALTQTKQQTSSEFFKQLEQVTGFPALATEFYFLVLRSLLLELCGIVLMAFSAYLLSTHIGQSAHPTPARQELSTAALRLKPPRKRPAGEPNLNSSWAAKYINALRQQSI